MAKICLLIDRPSGGAIAEGRLIHGFDQHFLEEKMRRAGILPDQLQVAAMSLDPVASVNSTGCDMIVPLGSEALRATTGKDSIDKWHLSPLDALPGYTARRVVPTFHFERIKKEYPLNLYFEMALRRANQHATPEPWKRKAARYLLDPGVDEAIATLESILDKEWHSIDIETGNEMVNTFGVAWSPEDAIAIKLLPEGMSSIAHHKIWELINRLCRSDSKKVMQNGIYERMYLSRYGIYIKNFVFDTMCAMKFLWPELAKGLDNVGRIYTMEPYWKDDGRVADSEGSQKDWNNIRDWPRHLDYNCKDSSNTLIAMHAQVKDLVARGLLEHYNILVARLFEPVYEMGTRGFPLSKESQQRLIHEYEGRSACLIANLSTPINVRSSKQKLKLLADKGFKLPQKRNKQKGTSSDSADELSLKKLRLAHPDDRDIQIFLEVSGIEKALSSYLRVRTLSDDRIRFMLDPHGTETGRMSCGKDPWKRGFNAQTMTGYVKQMIEWPADTDRSFGEIDLRQAETRFVAYDACEENLLGMLERDEDIHRYVASDIYTIPMSEVAHEQRQLGKKSGHGANYNMGVNTFMDSCLKEMDLVLTRQMASRVLEAYHKLFPGVRRWHARLRDQIYRERRLTTPLGRVRYFYGRPDDNTFREGFAYRPQSTVPDIINHLMWGLQNKRTEGAFDFWLHMQTHDSLTFSFETKHLAAIARYAFDIDAWHPTVILPAGRLKIPIEMKVGKNLGNLQKFKM